MDALLTLLRRCAGALVALGVAVPAAFAQAVSEPAVKAAYLYRFSSYIDWPSQSPADGPFVIGVQGAEEVATELERLVPGRVVHNRRVAIRRIRAGDDLKGVSVLFVGRGETNAREQVRAAQRQNTVTVTDTERGLELGSVINLVPVDDRVGFEVSLEAAERAGVSISSRMLSVARRVVPKG